MVRIRHDDWSVRLGENRSDQPLKHLAAMLYLLVYVNVFIFIN